MPRISGKKKYDNLVVSIDIDLPSEKIMTGANVEIIGQRLVTMTRDFMLKGISPVDGKKFALYKDTEKYPKNIRKNYPDKRNTPVNLKLTGDLHDSIGFKSGGKNNLLFGIINPKGNVSDYADVHNEGLRSDIARRTFLPTGRGETFNRTIMLELKRRLVSIIEKLLKKR